MKKFNRADKTLITVAGMFIIVLVIKTHYENVFTRGLLFCLEAALVGGIADWFAVTALFRKPLGIPWHTAILPRRREAFTKATIQLAQEQFFSRKNIFNHLKQFNASEQLILFMNDERCNMAAVRGADWLQQKLLLLDANQTAEKLIVFIHKNKDFVKIIDIDSLGRKYLRQDMWENILLEKLSALIYDKLSGEDGLVYLEAQLKKLADKKFKSGMSSFLFSLGGVLDVINNRECAALIQNKILPLIGQIPDNGSSIHKRLLSIMNATVDDVLAQNIWSDAAAEVKAAALSPMVLNSLITAGIKNIQGQFSQIDSPLKKDVVELLSQAVNLFLRDLHDNFLVKKLINNFINDIVGRSALQAQGMIGNIVRRAIANMSDAQLNELVYAKTKTDLIWIRMNGSIVGGGIGLLLFIGITVFNK
ncbi:DUF445 family protein [Pectinatus frisingensis]|uniref:DUF445 family protein n=1 Tax=Pectinatus frisingensis TaxID=865 RepID=UPI0018C803BB|nr:DUF445 family protein [Pectinatus frisingensis]